MGSDVRRGLTLSEVVLLSPVLACYRIIKTLSQCPFA
jgi:hypothetical protein